MVKKLAEEMLQRLHAADNPDREPTVKLDSDTLAIVNRWKLANFKETVSWLCKVADETLTEEQQQSESTPLKQ